MKLVSIKPNRTRFYRKYFKKVIWDYDIKTLDLENDEIFIWFLTRKINYHGLDGIRKADLQKYKKKLKNINPALKILIDSFL